VCEPATLAIIGASMASIGQVVGGITAMQQANFEASVAQQNAAIERENIQMEQERTSREALLQSRRVGQLVGEQRATAAANGVSTDFGTAASLIDDTQMLGREDLSNIYKQGNENVKGMDRNVANFVGESRAAKARGKGALVGSLFQAGGTMLSGASQFRSLKGGAPAFGSGSTTVGQQRTMNHFGNG
jgi:hypothetical protein